MVYPFMPAAHTMFTDEAYQKVCPLHVLCFVCSFMHGFGDIQFHCDVVKTLEGSILLFNVHLLA